MMNLMYKWCTHAHPRLVSCYIEPCTILYVCRIALCKSSRPIIAQAMTLRRNEYVDSDVPPHYIRARLSIKAAFHYWECVDLSTWMYQDSIFLMECIKAINLSCDVYQADYYCFILKMSKQFITMKKVTAQMFKRYCTLLKIYCTLSELLHTI